MAQNRPQSLTHFCPETSCNERLLIVVTAAFDAIYIAENTYSNYITARAEIIYKLFEAHISFEITNGSRSCIFKCSCLYLPIIPITFGI